MRITLHLDDDVMQGAREIARLKRQGPGQAISDLARRGLMRDKVPAVEIHNGVPVWTNGLGAVPVTSELVRNLADGE